MTQLEKLMYITVIKENQSGKCFDCSKCSLRNLCNLMDESDCFYDLLIELYNKEMKS